MSHDGLIPFDSYDPGSPTNDRQGGSHDLDIIDPEHQQQQARMERQWQAAEDIDKDVNDLNTSINSLIQTMGLDPLLLDETLAQTGGSGSTGIHDDDMQDHDADSNVNAADFDFFQFLNSMPASGSVAGADLHGADAVGESSAATNMDYGDLSSTAFLDETPAQIPSDPAAPPVQSLRHVFTNIWNMGVADSGLNAPLSSNSGLNLSASTVGTKASVADGNTAAPAGRLKRKSDVIVDFESMNPAVEDNTQVSPSTHTGTLKMKRRKDK